MEKVSKIKVVKLDPLITEESADKLEGKLLGRNDYEMLFVGNVDVYDKFSGKCLAKFRKNVIPPSVQIAAFDNLLSAAIPTDDRGAATGLKMEGKLKSRKVLKNGKLAKKIWTHGVTVNSGIAGFYDRSTRFPYCRQTSFNQHNFDKFKAAYPIIKLVDNYYGKLMPDHYKKQKFLADQTAQDFVIPGTSFTTITINKNWQTAVHKDSGDYTEGFGNLVALRKGTFTGGYFVLPRWGCAFDLQNGDLLMVDVHQWHGNTPIIKDDPKAVRLSLVMYYRENMIHCGTMEQELKRFKNRKKGDKLNG